MTNGEKIIEIFPNLEYEVKDHIVLTNIDNGVWFSLEWWNAKYKEPNKSEIPTSSTTKKCTTCAYREIDGKPHEMCKSCVCGNRYRDDAISRKEVLKMIDQIQDAGGFIGYNTCSAAFDVVNNMSPATPIRPKGHWIENAPEYQNIDPPYICSECGNMHLRKTNYCDQCGADMREVKDGKFKD